MRLQIVVLLALLGCVAPGAWAQSDDLDVVDVDDVDAVDAVDDVADVEQVQAEAAEPVAPDVAEPESEPEPQAEPEPEAAPEPPATKPSRAAAPTSSDLTYAENMLCGSVARLAASIILHPFDTLRTRAQARKRAQPNGVRFGAADIMLKGIVPQTVLAVPAGALHFATLEAARNGLSAPPFASRLNKPATDLLASAAGALAASLIRVPQEVLKQPVQAGLYQNSAAAARAVWRGGPRRLYRGFGATVLRDVPWNSLSYAFFRSLKLVLRAPEEAKSDMLLAAIGGAVAAVLLTPIDVAKTRLMTQSSADAVQYSGVIGTLARVLQEEGPAALFRGVLPRTIYLAPLAAIVYAVYEEAARLLKKLKERRALKDTAA